MGQCPSVVGTERAEGQSGGGAVRIELSSDRHEVKAVHFTPGVVQSNDEKLVADLVLAALQDALRRAQDAESEAIGKVTGGMHLPGLF